MTILDTWKDSLRIFLPKNFKLFFLVTVNAVIKASAIVVTQIWFWLLLLVRMLLGDYYLLQVIAFALINFGFILAARPSVAKKNYHYFLNYWPYAALYCLAPCLLDPLNLTQLFILFPFAGFFYFFILFFVDAPFGLVSAAYAAFRSLKMTIYNLPFIIISSLVFDGLFFAFTIFSFKYLSSSNFAMFWTLFTIVPICFFTNFYVKKIHDNFELYWGKQ